MIIQFRTSYLRNLCNRRERRVKKYGEALSQRLRLRLSELSSFVSLAESARFSCHDLAARGDQEYSIRVDDHARLVVATPDGCDDLADIEMVIVCRIEVADAR